LGTNYFDRHRDSTRLLIDENQIDIQELTSLVLKKTSSSCFEIIILFSQFLSETLQKAISLLFYLNFLSCLSVISAQNYSIFVRGHLVNTLFRQNGITANQLIDYIFPLHGHEINPCILSIHYHHLILFVRFVVNFAVV